MKKFSYVATIGTLLWLATPTVMATEQNNTTPITIKAVEDTTPIDNTTPTDNTKPIEDTTPIEDGASIPQKQQQGFVKIDNKLYYFLETGEKVIGFYTIPDSQQMIYTNQEGIVQTGWIQIGQERYYADTKTAFLRQSEWLKDKATNDWYYFNENAELVRDAIVDEYYVDKDGKRLQNQWVHTQQEQWYYFGNDGKYITNTWKGSYYLKENGQMAKQEWAKSPETGWHYFNPDGTYVQNKWVGAYYIKQWGYMAKNEWIYDKDYENWFYIKEDGSYARYTWKGSYYLKKWGEMAKQEWAWSPETGWHYFNPDGTYVQNKWVGDYYLKQWGYMAKNEWLYQQKDGNWNYVDANGKKINKGWVQVGTDWYYFKDGGYLESNRWIGSYYLENSGRMAKNKSIGKYYVDDTGLYRKKVTLDVPVYHQYPQAVNSCEVYALTQALHYKGYAKDKTAYQLTKEVKKSPNGNPHNGYVGNPYYNVSSIATVYPKALLPLAQQYAPEAMDATGYTLDQMKEEIVKGNPVIVWGTTPKFSYPTMNYYWFGPEPSNGHAIVLAGFKDDSFYCADSISGHYWVSSHKVAKAYQMRGKMAIIIK
ncbi:Uncharacterized protein YvpB [Granulicatella balaenopterae]|uniref:Uncharacterized protein YvpB n=1 Tax=Granulicatella balaenopterae TaxID=137733 RepID=A0A1H9KS80_9LACT|nr:C39 family peptidase [Granulicatella balaenopterae]SER01889.1 Uncharacterized protein YvpB [Granulicatella balaenopterae]